MKRKLAVALLAAAVAGEPAAGKITNGAVESYYSNPNIGTEDLTSFDWNASGDLYWMGGSAAGWGNPMSVYRYDGSLTTIDSRGSYAGSWVVGHGDYVYFDDGSNYSFNKYDAVIGGPADEVFRQANAWGYTIEGDGLFISGADASWNNFLFYSALDANGELTGPLVTLGEMGSPSGPIAFDDDGNLFYASGYSDGLIYRYSASEVDDAINGTPLGDAASHEFIDFNSYGLAGASGLGLDSEGNLVATLTSFGSPSRLVSFERDAAGGYHGVSDLLAESDGRMGAVRNHGGDIYFNDGDGIYKVLPEPSAGLLVLLGFGGLFARRRVNPDQS